MATTIPGGAVRARLREFGELTSTAGETLRQLPAAGRYFGETLRQTAILIRGTTPLIACLAFLIGIPMSNYGYYFLRSAGAADYVGLVSGVLIPRTTTAFIFGYMFAAKVGCGLVAEIGAMKINQELDAYESEGVGVQRFIVVPRVVGALLFVPIATGVALVAQLAGAFINSVYVLNAVPAETFLRFNWSNQGITDQLFALASLTMVAVCIVLVSCAYGLRASGGPAGVGRAVSRSLVVNLVMIHVITGVAMFTFYGGGAALGLPIGG